MGAFIPKLDVASFYQHFDVPITREDCGALCSPHNPSGKPFCCDICRAVPVAYRQEWDYLSANTDQWHEWRGDECTEEPVNPKEMRAETPEHLLLLACKGPQACQRQYRASSCRQFPFFPYVTDNYRFIGLAYYWDFEPTCWIISHLDRVTDEYRREFVNTYDEIFNIWPDEFESYAAMSEEMRDFFKEQHRRFPVLHRNGRTVLVSPVSERLQYISVARLRRFGPYDSKEEQR
ncbi:hypothetical protein [Leptolinea tardivitalis]|uniref:Uncharacterized protein n=1 Tax=Leptolinea tardivitalis TaxID=229920 RepID=A0A0P6WXL3_9CHLR|nr:hypothetical protein [Leptolinea tardivitalis]KPL73431.1 hypothetical protein ADM99_04340 [Leptolinea tardivitalis]GAP21589.1 hypothetical protein LTAR_01800 [Leptolinea tardivitalis]